MALQHKYVVKQVRGRDGENDHDWEWKRRSRQKAIVNEADMLFHAQQRGARFVPEIQALITIEGCHAVVMENAGAQ